MWTVFGLLTVLTGMLVMVGCAGSTIGVGAEPYPRGHRDRVYEGPGRAGDSPPWVRGHREHEGGPPPWAPAHGYRAKHSYHYYPSAEVYFDTGRGSTFISRTAIGMVLSACQNSSVRSWAPM